MHKVLYKVSSSASTMENYLKFRSHTHVCYAKQKPAVSQFSLSIQPEI